MYFSCHIWSFLSYVLVLTLIFVKTWTFLQAGRLLHSPFPIWSFPPFDLWYFLSKNTFLWTRELDWMGHRTRSFEWLPFYYCMIWLCHCLLAHLLLSPTPIVPTHCSIVTATCCHLLPSDRRSGGSFVSPPPAVPFGTYWYLLVPTVMSRWRHVAMIGSR